MGSSSSIMRAQELTDFRKLNTTIDKVDIPARPENRRLTDKKGFLIYGIAILILFPFLIYALVKSDLRRLTSGYDECGNLCGYNNPTLDGISCSGRDYTDKPYSQFGTDCVSSCPSGMSALGGICAITDVNKDNPFRNRQNPFDRWRRSVWDDYELDDDDDELRADEIQAGLRHCRKGWWKFLVSIFITIALSVLTLVLLRYVPAVVVWGVIIFSMIVLIVGTAGWWYLYSQQPRVAFHGQSNTLSGFFGVAIVWTIVALILIIVLIVLFKKIGLVVQLYKETTKAIAAMPLLIFVPVLITILQIIVLMAFIITSTWMATSRELIKYPNDRYKYEMTGVVIFAIIFNFIMTCWTMRFISGIQYMTISGSVSSWYFAKNKQYLDSPICTSFCNTMKFHIGTIAFGSFILTLFSVIKAILRACCRNACCRCFVVMCCNNLEVILKFLSENSYIETAIHGQSYFRSAKRATKLLLTNAASVIAINCVGDFVLGMIVFILTVISTAISYALFMSYGALIPTLICLLVNIIIVSITFGIFQTTIDTLFICFCEDMVLNDGLSRPYFMSRGLMEFVENSKKVYGEKGRQ